MPASHSLILRSSLPEAMVEPQGLKATLRTESVCPCNVVLRAPVPASHTLYCGRDCPRRWPVEPQGLNACNAHDTTCVLTSCSVVLRAPVPASHSLILRSSLPEAMHAWCMEPQGLKATLLTHAICVSLQCGLESTRARVPQLDLVVVTARRQEISRARRPVRTQHHLCSMLEPLIVFLKVVLLPIVIIGITVLHDISIHNRRGHAENRSGGPKQVVTNNNHCMTSLNSGVVPGADSCSRPAAAAAWWRTKLKLSDRCAPPRLN